MASACDVRLVGHRDHGDARELRVLLLLDAELPAVHDRHHQVQQDDVGRVRGAQ